MKKMNRQQREEAKDAALGLVRMVDGFSDERKVRWFMELFEETVPLMVDTTLEVRRMSHDNPNLALSLVVPALAGFLRGMLEAEETLAVRSNLDAEERDEASRTMHELNRVTMQAGHLTGLKFARVEAKKARGQR